MRDHRGGGCMPSGVSLLLHSMSRRIGLKPQQRAECLIARCVPDVAGPFRSSSAAVAVASSKRPRSASSRPKPARMQRSIPTLPQRTDNGLLDRSAASVSIARKERLPSLRTRPVGRIQRPSLKCADARRALSMAVSDRRCRVTGTHPRAIPQPTAVVTEHRADLAEKSRRAQIDA